MHTAARVSSSRYAGRHVAAPDAASSKHSAGTRRSSTSGEEHPAGTNWDGVNCSGVQSPSSIWPVAAAREAMLALDGSFRAAAKSVRARPLPAGHSMAAAPDEPRSDGLGGVGVVGLIFFS